MSAIAPLPPSQIDPSPEARIEGLVKQSAQGTPGASGASFENVLVRTVEDAAASDRASAKQVDAFAAGLSDDLHGTMISMKEAEISMKLVGSIRNKLLDAFHELWRTSV